MTVHSDFLEVEDMILQRLRKENPRYFLDMRRNSTGLEGGYLEKRNAVHKCLGLRREIRELELAIETQRRLNAEVFEDIEYFKAHLRSFCGWEEPPSVL